jgi:putative Ca2+/H+ antiporter (TMEM165/GDT1 family)
VFVGAFVALASVAALGAFGGRALLRVLPLAAIRKVGGVLLAGFAVYSLVRLALG